MSSKRRADGYGLKFNAWPSYRTAAIANEQTCDLSIEILYFSGIQSQETTVTE